MSLFGTPSRMFHASLGRVGEYGNGEGEHNDEVRDETPSSVGGELDPMLEEDREYAGKFESAPGDTSLGRILDPGHS